MECPTDQELSWIALGATNEKLTPHIESCDRCRVKVAYYRTVMDRLSAAHTPFSEQHEAARSQLMSMLPATYTERRLTLRERFLEPLKRWMIRRPAAAAGIGLSTLAGIVLLIAIIVNLATPLSAMDRMVRELRAVTSYRYDMYAHNTFVPEGESKVATVLHTGTTYWTAPNSLRYDEKIVRTEGKVFSGERDGLLAEFQGIHPSGSPGMMVHHFTRYGAMVGTYVWVPEVPAYEIGDSGPIMRLRMVREGEGEVLRELGTKEINGKPARGFVMALADATPGSGFDALEVWVDPQTQLPMEFGYEVKTGNEVQSFRISNCQWSVEIPPSTFETTPPAGYEDITAPKDEETFAKITDALKSYAQLSGGRFPEGSSFDADAVYSEMLKLAGFTGPAKPEWDSDGRFQRIQNSRAGLDWIERILRHRFATGYDGTGVTIDDKDKPLLWWTVDIEDSYRVFYGNLRTEIIPYSQWLKIVPPKFVEDQQPRGRKVD
jgi:outer membrane lipoprotein-sorting protein